MKQCFLRIFYFYALAFFSVSHVDARSVNSDQELIRSLIHLLSSDKPLSAHGLIRAKHFSLAMNYNAGLVKCQCDHVIPKVQDISSELNDICIAHMRVHYSDSKPSPYAFWLHSKFRGWKIAKIAPVGSKTNDLGEYRRYNVFSRRNNIVEVIVHEWTADLGGRIEIELINIDGDSVSNTFDKDRSRDGICDSLSSWR